MEFPSRFVLDPLSLTGKKSTLHGLCSYLEKPQKVESRKWHPGLSDTLA